MGRSGAAATIFVLDTGVLWSHSEFFEYDSIGNAISRRMFTGLDMTVGSPKECKGDFKCAADRNGHGTHCAGTAAGWDNGVARRAKITSVKVHKDDGSGPSSWSYYALDWIARGTVRPAVATMSLRSNGVTRGTAQAMKNAVDAAVRSGVTVVVSAGDNNRDACRYSPAFVPSAITVGATKSTDVRSSFSNYGSCTNIWAPGQSVNSASSACDLCANGKSGTAMACAHVSGAAALVLDADPGKSPSGVLDELLKKAYKGKLSGLKSGDTNALLNVASY